MPKFKRKSQILFQQSSTLTKGPGLTTTICFYFLPHTIHHYNTLGWVGTIGGQLINSRLRDAGLDSSQSFSRAFTVVPETLLC